MDYTIRIGGEAGQGIQTIGDTLAKVFSRSGYHVFSHQDFESRIRGGHSFYQIRLSDEPVLSSRERADILVALDLKTVHLHEGSLTDGAVVLYDPAMVKETFSDPRFLAVPFLEIAMDAGAGKIGANTVATGSVLGMLGMDPAPLVGVLRDSLANKGDAVVGANIRASDEGLKRAVRGCLQCGFTLHGGGKPHMLLNANDAIGLGAIGSGCTFYCAYPMTPSTGVMLFLASKARECGIIVEQAEDEISAINMALGASFAGARSMTGTSGGGFALMAEGLSLAGMTETPIVVLLAQRPGPATGFPTRTEQGDLLFALHGGHGEFPRVIFAPGSPEQAFSLTSKAFDLSQKYQIPVLILTDQYLADSQWTYDSFDMKGLRYTEYRLRSDLLNEAADYRRHAWTEDGVSPFAIPGGSRHVVVTDSDEHDEEGHITEDGETRRRMVEKRLFRKMDRLKQEISPPFFHGHARPKIVVVGWGSTFGVMKDAVDILVRNNDIAMIHFSEVYPFPDRTGFDYLRLLEEAKLTICVENNATGQFARLFRAETGFNFDVKINKYDGRPFTLDELLGEKNAHLRKL